jgi:hypothetical protein
VYAKPDNNRSRHMACHIVEEAFGLSHLRRYLTLLETRSAIG